MKGILYGVGVGPGDPKLMTLRAVELLESCDLVALPTSESVAFEIARAAVPSLERTELLKLSLPMTREPALLKQARHIAAERICEQLDAGKMVVFLTLGDSTIYATYSYLHELVVERGHTAQYIPGVPSFCAGAALAGVSLTVVSQPLHILPSSYEGWESGLDLPGTKVLMKSGTRMGMVKQLLTKRGLDKSVTVVERCGMSGERVYHDLAQVEDDASYFSLVIVPDKKEG